MAYRIAVNKCFGTRFHVSVTQSRSYSRVQDYMVVNEEVREALSSNKPVVALESTILTHGMPYPDNLRMGRSVEQIIRDNGAVPATIALMSGKAYIGVSDSMLEQISDTSNHPSVKVSRRDIAYALNMGLTGGTTISGTMVLAHAAGMRIFVSGGLGGVHRGGETTMDVSADLTELGKTPVTLVTSGVKSILDIGRTLEYLETQGVCVATFGSTTQFPAFFSSKSGYESCCNLADVEEAAQLVHTSMGLGLKNGILIANPIPEEFELQGQTIEDSVQQAVTEADEAGVRGKEITPYILSRVNDLTKGLSLQSNIALVENNAKVGAQIATRLSELEKTTSSKGQQSVNTYVTRRAKLSQEPGAQRRPTVIGACNLDTIMHIQSNDIKFNGQTNQAISSIQCGGVGRNLSDGLSRLGSKPRFLTALGSDVGGDSIINKCPHMDWSLAERLDDHSTANYTVVLNIEGDVVLGVGDMNIHEQITPQYIEEHEAIIKDSSLLILDGNLSVSAIKAAGELSQKHHVPIFYEPADVDKATKPFKAGAENTIKYIKPNLLELAKIYRHITGKTIDQIDTQSDNLLDYISDICLHISQYIPNILVTVGAKGVIYCTGRADYESSSRDNTTVIKNSADQICLHMSAEQTNNIKSVSGAGDCLAAAFIYGQLGGLSISRSLDLGLKAASLSIQAYETVPGDIASLVNKNIIQ